MNEMGNILKQARKEQQLSLEEIESKIKIRKKYLEALETENFEVFPGDVYLIGFLRNYASFLNLNSNQLVELVKLNLQKEKDEVPITKPKKDTTGYKTMNKNKYNYTKIFKYLLVAGLLILIVGYFIYYFTNEPNSEFVPPKNIIEEDIHDIKPPPDQDIGDVVEQQIRENLQLVLVISQEQGARCWVEVKTDGQLSYSGTLEQGEEKSFQADEKINIRLGNAGVVTLFYNDENIGLAGPLNKVVDLEFLKD